MELYTRRSISECLSEAWTLLSTNLRRITKSLWLPALLLSLASGITAPMAYNMENNLLMGKFDVADAASISTGLVVLMAAFLYLYAKIYKLLNEQTIGFCIGRLIKLTVIMFVVSIVIAIVICLLAVSVTSSITTGSVASIIGIFLALFAVLLSIIIVIIVFTPAFYASMKYLIEPEMKLKDYWKAYKVGFRNFGKILGVVLLCAIIVYFAQIFISTPGTIAIMAAGFSLEGVANGDSNGLPSMFSLIFGATSFISSAVTTVLMIWNTFAQYYLYASIEAKERETLPTPPVRAGE